MTEFYYYCQDAVGDNVPKWQKAINWFLYNKLNLDVDQLPYPEYRAVILDRNIDSICVETLMKDMGHLVGWTIDSIKMVGHYEFIFKVTNNAKIIDRINKMLQELSCYVKVG